MKWKDVERIEASTIQSADCNFCSKPANYPLVLWDKAGLIPSIVAVFCSFECAYTWDIVRKEKRAEDE